VSERNCVGSKGSSGYDTDRGEPSDA